MRTLTILVLAGCSMPRDGLRATPPGDGPEVVVDWDAEPLPELPFPNDLATLRDPSSPTGLRVNIAGEAHTEYESIARHKLDGLRVYGVTPEKSVARERNCLAKRTASHGRSLVRIRRGKINPLPVRRHCQIVAECHGS